MLTGSLDRNILVYDSYLVKSNELNLHQGKINSIVYLSAYSFLVSSSHDTSIIFWKTVSNFTNT
jgi:WD40 repeat protein